MARESQQIPVYGTDTGTYYNVAGQVYGRSRAGGFNTSGRVLLPEGTTEFSVDQWRLVTADEWAAMGAQYPENMPSRIFVQAGIFQVGISRAALEDAIQSKVADLMQDYLDAAEEGDFSAGPKASGGGPGGATGTMSWYA